LQQKIDNLVVRADRVPACRGQFKAGFYSIRFVDEAAALSPPHQLSTLAGNKAFFISPSEMKRVSGWSEDHSLPEKAASK
jgi:hypothetical protein